MTITAAQLTTRCPGVYRCRVEIPVGAVDLGAAFNVTVFVDDADGNPIAAGTPIHVTAWMKGAAAFFDDDTIDPGVGGEVVGLIAPAAFPTHGGATVPRNIVVTAAPADAALILGTHVVVAVNE